MIMRLTGISNEMAAKQWSRHTGQRTSYRSDGNRILPLNSGMKDYRESLAVAYIFFRKFRKTRLSLPKTKIKWLLQSVLIYVTAATIWSAHFGGEPLFLLPPLPRRSYVTPRAKSPANRCQNLALFTNFYSQITTFPSSTLSSFLPTALFQTTSNLQQLQALHAFTHRTAIMSGIVDGITNLVSSIFEILYVIFSDSS